MELKLTYTNIEELIPFSKAYFDICHKPSKIWEMILAAYVILSLLFYSYFRTIIKDPILIFIIICILIFYSMRYLYAIIFYKKYNQLVLKIDFDANRVYFQNQDGYIIDKQKSKIINENSILLMVEKKTLKIGIPITGSCDDDLMKRIIDYISIS